MYATYAAYAVRAKYDSASAWGLPSFVDQTPLNSARSIGAHTAGPVSTLDLLRSIWPVCPTYVSPSDE